MDLVQIGGSLFAIVVLALIARWLFPSKAELNEDRIARNVARYCPETNLDVKTDRIFLSEDKKNAVFVFGNPRFGIATTTALGDRVVVRHFPDVGQANFRFENGNLSLNSDDFTQPTFIVTLDPAKVAELLSALEVTPNKDTTHVHA